MTNQTLVELIVKWRAEAAAEQRVSFHADELEAAITGQEAPYQLTAAQERAIRECSCGFAR